MNKKNYWADFTKFINKDKTTKVDDASSESVTRFEDIMFINNPMRAVKFAQFLSYTSKVGWLRKKLMVASKDSSFWQIADSFEHAHSEDHKRLWEITLPESINTFLDELENHKEIDFSKNDIDEVKKALNSVFALNLKKSSVKSKIKEGLNSILS